MEKYKSILEEAHAIVNGARQEKYGDFVNTLVLVAAVVSLLTGKDIKPEDIAKVMIAMKLIREKNKHDRENLVDLCGYAEGLNRLKEEGK
jgi:hypothetical protein